jgi:hypothetical protein
MKTSFFARIGLALKVLFSRAFTEQLVNKKVKPVLTQADTDSALQLIALLQKEGRFLDFIQEEITPYSDAQVGAAARVLHQGLRKALTEHVNLVPVATVSEGQLLTLPADFDAHAYRLVGNISGEGPFNGTLIHKGWKAEAIELPRTAPGYDFTILAPAEVEV